MKISVFFFLILFTSFAIQAQSLQVLDVEVEINGKQLISPFAGGLNAPQYYKIDLNNDGLEDIFVFDRVGFVPLGFLNRGDGTFQYSPDAVSGFPSMRQWVVVRDYNNDGIPDLFTYSLKESSSIRIFTGKWNGDLLAFDQMIWPDQPNSRNDVLFEYNSLTLQKTIFELYTNNVDIPAIYDVDGDGDLDILTFGNQGFLLKYYQNKSVELGFGTDSLIYVLEDPCFGKFYEEGVTSAVILSDDPNKCASQGILNDEEIEDNRSLRHAGATVTALDLNGDGLTDLLLGGVSFNELTALINGGSVENAWITEQDPTFPSYDSPVNINSFPAAFVLDVDNDGRDDLIVSPNDPFTKENANVGWYYKDVGHWPETVFSLIQKDFIVGDMIDLGAGTAPAFFDYNGDGLMDMVVGMYDYYTGEDSFNSRLVLFENVGTKEVPSFRLVDNDYLGFTQFDGAMSFEFTPHFADMDGDGDMDLIVGEFSGNLYYAENMGGAGNPAQFGPIQFGWKGIKLDRSVVPYVHDMDGDGLPDLLFGDRIGQVRFFKNIGTESEPDFISNTNTEPNIRALGGLTVKGFESPLGLSAPAVLYENGVKKLIVGSDVEQIHVYNISDQSNLTVPFERSFDEDISQLNTGRRMRPAFADLTNDGFLEMVVGNDRGGLNLYKTNYKDNDSTTSTYAPQMKDFSWSISPNPAFNEVQVVLDIADLSDADPINLRLFNSLGQVVLSRKFNRDQVTLYMEHLPTGFYSLELSSEGKRSTKKILKR